MTNPKLSILICHKPGREHFLSRLKQRIWPQLGDDAEMVIHDGIGMPIGQKRNELLQGAEGEYVCFIDDDDLVSENYVQLLMEGIDKGVDCCSLKGIITEDGKRPQVFEHSIQYKEYRTVGGEDNTSPGFVRYERYPNHLNCIKASIAKQFRFPELNHGEDTEWATQIHKSGLLKVEHYIPEVIYYYEYISKK
jgi:glycosyltransferase involved in cell wall biosynthesis